MSTDDDEFEFSDGTKTTSSLSSYQKHFETDPLHESGAMYATGVLAVLKHISREYIDLEDVTSLDSIEKLGGHLADHNWAEVDVILSVLGKAEHFTCLELACAMAGKPGYADIIAQHYAGIAVRLSLTLRAHRPVGDEQMRIADDAAYRLRSAVIQSVSWSAVGGDHNRYRQRGRTVHDTAYDIGIEVDTVLTASIAEILTRRHLNEIKVLFESYVLRISERSSKALDLSTSAEDLDVSEIETEAEPVHDCGDGDGLLVVRAVGSAGTTGGKEAANALKDVLGKRVPLVCLERNEIEIARQSLGSGLIDQSQKMTAAAMHMAEKKV